MTYTQISKKTKKEARVKLEKFLEELEELHEQSSIRIEDWCIILKNFHIELEKSNLKEIANTSNDEGFRWSVDSLHMYGSEIVTSTSQIEVVYDDLKSAIRSVIDYLPRSYLQISKWDKIPFISYLGFICVILAIEYSTVIAFIAVIAGLVLTFACKSLEDIEKQNKKKWKEKDLEKQREAMSKQIEETRNRERREPETNYEDRRQRSKGIQFRIFAAVFGIIAAFAITETLYTFPSGIECTDENGNVIKQCFDNTEKLQDLPKLLLSEQVLVVGSFFAIGILFYQCGIMVLSTDVALLIEEGNRKSAFVSSIIIFLEGIVLFIAATSTDSLLRFSLWIFVLLALDIVWVLINLYARIDILFQWLHLDSLMMLFLLVVLLSPVNLGSSIKLAGIGFNYWAVIMVFVLRSVLDYKMGWKYWTKVPTEEN